MVEFVPALRPAGASPEINQEAGGKSHALGAFICSLVGLDCDAAWGIFSEFIKGETTTANEFECTTLIVFEQEQNK